ncbi:MAG: ABC transporter ATP-binding protein, partial [Treponema sp.]|nr:ABC transporter ATP-binding protein [Treponema sp.]
LDPKTAKKVLDLTEHFIKKDNLTAFMVTHNMKDAIRYGNKLIMMLDGKIVYEASGEEKKNLQVSDLLAKFQTVSGNEDQVSDRMLLSN